MLELFRKTVARRTLYFCLLEDGKPVPECEGEVYPLDNDNQKLASPRYLCKSCGERFDQPQLDEYAMCYTATVTVIFAEDVKSDPAARQALSCIFNRSDKIMDWGFAIKERSKGFRYPRTILIPEDYCNEDLYIYTGEEE